MGKPPRCPQCGSKKIIEENLINKCKTCGTQLTGKTKTKKSSKEKTRF
jgi:ribosomal protein L37AE/L43A|tara:strand:+ start:191 stop:334 length:144 start_codon:yes stop_codon:yes gene_type:complete